MARKRRSQSAAIRFGPALKAVLLCMLIGGSGLGYVWQKEQIAKLGQLKKQKETRLAVVEDENDFLRKQLAKMRSFESIEDKIRTGGLGLGKPLDTQILRLPEPVPEPARAKRSSQYAAR